MKKKVIAVIPARKNSKRIPGKNYKKFNGIPAIVSTIKKLKKSKIFDRIIVSTNCEKTAKISKSYGAEIPFWRPKILSNDFASGSSVMSHCIKFLENEGCNFDYACFVFAPNPFLKINDLKKGFQKIRAKKCDFVFAATSYQFPFFRSFTISDKKGIKMLFSKNYKKRSQDLKQILCDAGQFYWGYKEAWIKEKIVFSKRSDVVLIPKWRYQDIDTLEDWKRAEKLSKII
jgi:N-acylneuraminate cytidylyltransferase